MMTMAVTADNNDADDDLDNASKKRKRAVPNQLPLHLLLPEAAESMRLFRKVDR